MHNGHALPKGLKCETQSCLQFACGPICHSVNARLHIEDAIYAAKKVKGGAGWVFDNGRGAALPLEPQRPFGLQEPPCCWAADSTHPLLSFSYSYLTLQSTSLLFTSVFCSIYSARRFPPPSRSYVRWVSDKTMGAGIQIYVHLITRSYRSCTAKEKNPSLLPLPWVDIRP